jgi:hypothetical protein
MDEPREELSLEPEAEESIRQITEGLRLYLRLLLTRRRLVQPTERSED